MNSLIDLPFALPTIVAGLTLLALYGPEGPFGFDVAFTRFAVVLALLFVTLPFVVRAVQPVLLELDRDVEQAAESLGATPFVTFRRIILPALFPAIVAGCGLAFARAIGEFGSLVLITGNLPFKTQAASVFIYSQVESDNVTGAAAVSVVLLVISFVVLLGFAGVAQGWCAMRGRLALRSIAIGYLGLAARLARGAGLLPRLRARPERLLGGRHHAGGPARALAHAAWSSDRGAAQHDLRRACALVLVRQQFRGKASSTRRWTCRSRCRRW